MMWNFYFEIAGMVLLLPGYLVAYAFLRKVSAAAIWVPLAGLDSDCSQCSILVCLLAKIGH
jgi:hypothetical protein